MKGTIMKKTIATVGLALAASLVGISQVGAAPMPSVSSTGTTVAPKTTVTTIAAKTTVTTTAPKTTTAPVVTESSTGGVITFTVSGSTAKSFEITAVYKGVTKNHRFIGTSLTLKGKAGQTIKFRIRSTVPTSTWGAWQTATVA